MGMGEIRLICGSMFSGKSTELLRHVRRYAVTHKNIVVFTHEKDVRFGEDWAVTTHDVMVVKSAASFQVHAVSSLSDSRADNVTKNATIICIDEGQFFDDLAPSCNKWADAGKIVVVAALDTTFERKPWPSMANLCPDYITKLTAVCVKCGADAPFTRRISANTEVEVVGGKEEYEAVCRGCYVQCAHTE